MGKCIPHIGMNEINPLPRRRFIVEVYPLTFEGDGDERGVPSSCVLSRGSSSYA
jgi:hypothetical protein